VTICAAFATPAVVPLVAEADELADELAEVAEVAGLVVVVLELEPLELQAASTAAAVSAAPGASQRFHLCVIAFYASIPPLTRGP
jgi:hypothetical protein